MIHRTEAEFQRSRLDKIPPCTILRRVIKRVLRTSLICALESSENFELQKNF